MSRDLASMRFSNVVELPHGTSYDLSNDLRITSYQFSPWGGSAAVIEADGVALLDANDAKFMGSPLHQILNSHNRINFSFRSHSSANDRVCYKYLDDDEIYEEDATLYTSCLTSDSVSYEKNALLERP
jgi:UDP-MurNAc hydroxylase